MDSNSASNSDSAQRLRTIGRGAQFNTPARFERIHLEPTVVDSLHDCETNDARLRNKISTQYFVDNAKSIISENNSPDIPFRYSVNPYRGCAHGCAYCYARPNHEYMGLSAGLDFESKIFVKLEAAKLLRQELSGKGWTADPIMCSGVTDCYQPAEREFRLTRQCLEVAWECRQPISIVTKNALVLRDLDILQPLAAHNLVHVYLSITSLDAALARDMEPRTSSPEARLRTVRELSEAGIDVTVMVAPLIPGFNDSEMPGILQAASEAGAKYASYIVLRLPLSVEPIFLDWLARNAPNQVEKVVGRISQVRNGKRSDAKFGRRMRGEGPFADHLSQTFHVFAQKFGLSSKTPALNQSLFSVPTQPDTQMRLF